MYTRLSSVLQLEMVEVFLQEVTRKGFSLCFIPNWSFTFFWPFFAVLSLRNRFSGSSTSASVTPHVRAIMLPHWHPGSHMTGWHSHRTRRTMRSWHVTTHHGAWRTTWMGSRGTHHHMTMGSRHRPPWWHTRPMWSTRTKWRKRMWSMMSEWWCRTTHSMFCKTIKEC